MITKCSLRLLSAEFLFNLDEVMSCLLSSELPLILLIEIGLTSSKQQLSWLTVTSECPLPDWVVSLNLFKNISYFMPSNMLSMTNCACVWRDMCVLCSASYDLCNHVHMCFGGFYLTAVKTFDI